VMIRITRVNFDSWLPAVGGALTTFTNPLCCCFDQSAPRFGSKSLEPPATMMKQLSGEVLRREPAHWLQGARPPW